MRPFDCWDCGFTFHQGHENFSRCYIVCFEGRFLCYGPFLSRGFLPSVKYVLCWEITQSIVVIPYRRFGSTYRSHLHWSRNTRPLKIGLTGCPEISQKSADLIYFAAEAWNHATEYVFCHCDQVRTTFTFYTYNCFHRANWHSSAILTEVSPCSFLSFKANARV